MNEAMGTSISEETPAVTTAKPSARDIAAVVRTLSYFDIFHHPLTLEEIGRFSTIDTGCLGTVLHALCSDGVVQRDDGYHALGHVREAVQRRKVQEQRAALRMPKALRMSRFIGRFPFVRGVMLSGSISKGVLTADGDIDYFVITTPGRLWVARTLLIAFKKLFLLNSRRDFCVNYFVDTEHLAIEDRNLFTATEIATLIPTYGAAACAGFFAANTWITEHLPNTPDPLFTLHDRATGRGKRTSERLLDTRFGEQLDELFMRLTFLRWKRKFRNLDARSFELALRTRKYVSKHHPQSFQQRVLGALEERMRGFAVLYDARPQ